MEAKVQSQYSGIPITEELVRNIKSQISPQNLGLSSPDVSDMCSSLRIFASRVFEVNPAIEFRLETLFWRKENC